MINYAPIINTSVPGFLIEDATTAKKLRVYFTHNIAVSKAEVKAISVIIKPYSQLAETNYIAQGRTQGTDPQHSYHDLDKGQLVLGSISTSGVPFVKGAYYKVQIAYVDYDNNIGPYSSVGITRCLGNVGNTELFVEGLDIQNKQNIPQRVYMGYFLHDTDIVENVYSYRFKLTDQTANNIITDTGTVLAEYDENGQTVMSLNVLDEPIPGHLYTLFFEITTVNGYHTSVSYSLSGNLRNLPNMYKESIIAYQDADGIENGYVTISLKSRNVEKAQGTTQNGDFILLRKELGSRAWYTLTKFKLTSQSDFEKFIWKDFSIESGKTYIYGIEQYYQDQITQEILYSDKVITPIPIRPQFEHIFLSDGKRQLKIAYNPQVSSIKTVTLETKVDTIGNKYPIFSRNGKVGYKEMPLSGLISYHMDLNSYFLTENELGLDNWENRQKRFSPIDRNTDIVIDGLNVNEYNRNLMYYTLLAPNVLDIVDYRFYVYDPKEAAEEKTNLAKMTWQPVKYDIYGQRIMDFTLDFEIPEGKVYVIRAEVRYHNQEGIYEIGKTDSYYISDSVMNPQFNLTADNFAMEKHFKTLVYDWLNNGKPKFFRSPAEGNFILRLMNVSLSPNTTVGRMLHTFSATGYEIAECSMEQLKELQLIKYANYNNTKNNLSNSSNIENKIIYTINHQTLNENVFIPIVLPPNANVILDGVNENQLMYKEGLPYYTKNIFSNTPISSNDKVTSILLDAQELTTTATITVTSSTHDLNEFNKMAKYGKVETIELKTTEDIQDPWNYKMILKKDDDIISVKELKRLYTITCTPTDPKNPEAGCNIYFSNGTIQTYRNINEVSSNLRLADLHSLKNYDNIVKIRPIDSMINITGLFTYATTAQLGQFQLNNSRLGDELT